jgi:lyso-ornithine lipid O-acyltransferase
MINQDSKRRPSRLIARRHAGVAEGGVPELAPLSRRPRLGRMLRAVRRLALILVWTLVAVPIQAVILLFPGRGKVNFARFYWAIVCRLAGMRVRMIGAQLYRGDRPVVFVCNHSSWLDIMVLGGTLPACFISKAAVGHWPVVGTIARLGRTVFVSRSRTATARERDDMRARLAAGDNLILFPEGTSSDGSRVLPFRSAFFSLAEGGSLAEGETPPIMQPLSLVYDRLAGLPVGHAARPMFSWYGGMALGPHAWRFMQLSGTRATLLVHPPLDPALIPSRKALAAATWRSVAEGAAALRQNRAARPIVAAPEAVVPGIINPGIKDAAEYAV